MLDELRRICEEAAAEATAQLESLAFGAIDQVLLSDVMAASDEGTNYFKVSWSVVSMGMEDSRVSMVILPEFLGDEGISELAEQMAAYVVDKVLNEAQEG
jgi:hypothetical protein